MPMLKDILRELQIYKVQIIHLSHLKYNTLIILSKLLTGSTCRKQQILSFSCAFLSISVYFCACTCMFVCVCVCVRERELPIKTEFGAQCPDRERERLPSDHKTARLVETSFVIFWSHPCFNPNTTNHNGKRNFALSAEQGSYHV